MYYVYIYVALYKEHTTLKLYKWIDNCSNWKKYEIIKTHDSELKGKLKKLKVYVFNLFSNLNRHNANQFLGNIYISLYFTSMLCFCIFITHIKRQKN